MSDPLEFKGIDAGFDEILKKHAIPGPKKLRESEWKKESQEKDFEHVRKMLGKDRGFHHADAMKAAEELRMEGKGSHDPHYENSKKNK